VSADLTIETLQTLPLPILPRDCDKEDRGSVLVVGGGADMLGAVALAGLAALRVGAGKLQMRAERRCVPTLAALALEARIIEGRDGTGLAALIAAIQSGAALVIGPGMEERRRHRRLALDLLSARTDAVGVVDAGALPAPAEARAFATVCRGRAVVTPHAGEMAFMLGIGKAEVKADPEGAARRAAACLQAVVVMKGATTYVVSPEGTAWRHEGGVAGLATSGSGDVLAGVIGGLLARGAAPLTAAAWGVVAHAEAGAALSAGAPLGFLARDLLDVLPQTLARLSPEDPPSG